MFSILFMNLLAPLIDHVVVEANARRRRARYLQGSTRRAASGK